MPPCTEHHSPFGRGPRIKEVLRADERFLKEVFASIQDGIGVVDAEMNVVQVNPTMERWYAHALPLVGKKCFEAYHGRREPCGVCPAREVFRTGAASHEVVPKMGPAGEVVGWLELYAFPLRREGADRPSCAIEYVRDVTRRHEAEEALRRANEQLESRVRERTRELAEANLALEAEVSERRRAEEALRESEARARAIIEKAGIGVALVDMADATIQETNPALEQMLGYEAEELRGVAFGRLTHPDDLPAEALQFERASRGEIDHYRTEKRYFRKDGSVLWAKLTASVIQSADGVPRFAVGMVEDVTESRRDAKRLREVGEALEALVRASPLAVVVIDSNGGVQRWNSAAERLFGWTEQDVVGRTLPIVPIEDQAEFQRILGDQLLGCAQFGVELTRLRKDGARISVSLWTAPLRDPGGEIAGVIGIYADITERKRAEERVRAYQEELQVLAGELSLAEERERRRIATELHDRIGQTLAFAKMKVGALEAAWGGDDGPLADLRHLLDQAIRDTRLLTFELSSPILYELGLEASLEWLVEDAGRRHGLTAGFRDDGRPKPLAEDVKVLLFQAVRELLVNAAKHARAKGVRVQIRRRGGTVRITVQDDGVGGASLASPAAGPAGAGFGLFSIRVRLQQHGGRLEIESRKGRGTRVLLVAPLSMSGREDGQADSNPSGRRSPDGPGRTPGDAGGPAGPGGGRRSGRRAAGSPPFPGDRT